MNKAELIEALADKTGLQKQEAKKVLDAYIEIVTERMSENEEIVLVGFGTLIPRPQTAKNGADCYSKNGDAVTVLTWQS